MIRKLALLSFLCLPLVVYAESVAEKASEKRNELIRYLREIRTMSYNFPCDPFPDCAAALPQQTTPATGTTPATTQPSAPALPERVKLYNEIKKIYQEGMVYLYEGNHVNSYNRFLDSQARVEKLLEGLSQLYLDRTELMMRDAIEKKDATDPIDRSATDISIDYGANSDKRRDFTKNREIPRDSRAYNPREVHYAYNKYEIERNIEQGYKMLGQAREARRRALTVDANLAPNQRLDPRQRRARIEFYLESIQLARQAKFNAERIFQLKYPYDNYALMNPYGKTEAIRGDAPRAAVLPTIGGEKRDYSVNPNPSPIAPVLDHPQYQSTGKAEDKSNPYIYPAKLNPVFDLRIPEPYRLDASDARDQIYDDQIDINVKYRYIPSKRNKATEQPKTP